MSSSPLRREGRPSRRSEQRTDIPTRPPAGQPHPRHVALRSLTGACEDTVRRAMSLIRSGLLVRGSRSGLSETLNTHCFRSGHEHRVADALAGAARRGGGARFKRRIADLRGPPLRSQEAVTV